MSSKSIFLISQRQKKDCISYIINYNNSGDFREQIKSGGKLGGKKKSAATKPVCITNDGTLLRVISTVTSSDGKSIYIQTNHKQSKEELDTRKGH